MQCYKCNRECRNPQRVEVSESIPLKANGWIGTTFVPYGRRYKAALNLKHPVMCGMCAANYYLEREKEGGNDVTELQAALLAMAEKEVSEALTSGDNGRNGHHQPKASKSTLPQNGNGRKRNGRARRPKMTADQARHFDRVSVANYALVKTALAGTCDCDPYTDVFTFDRWLAQSNPVRRGQHAVCKLPLVKNVTDEDEEGNATSEPRKVFATAHVFCRCQTKAVKA